MRRATKINSLASLSWLEVQVMISIAYSYIATSEQPVADPRISERGKGSGRGRIHGDFFDVHSRIPYVFVVCHCVKN